MGMEFLIVASSYVDDDLQVACRAIEKRMPVVR